MAKKKIVPFKCARDSAEIFRNVIDPVFPKRAYDDTSERDVSELIAMLRYRRKAGSVALAEFCDRFLAPHFGKPDAHGNFVKVIGEKPRLAFMAHHDSVHTGGGTQSLNVANDWVSLSKDSDSNCLGADCATGIWLCLEMMRAGVPGVYVIHADEESGCNGSRALVADNPEWLSHIGAAISFDRMRTNSIITHQSSGMTASDQFAESLGDAIGLGMVPDDGGSYTDSNEYADVIAECTNVSVGYYGQHGRNEIQDLRFAAVLADRLCVADFGSLEIVREPGDFGWQSYRSFRWNDDARDSDWRRAWDDMPGYGRDSGPSVSMSSRDAHDRLVDMIGQNPEAVADLLESYGIDANEAMREIAEIVFGGNY